MSLETASLDNPCIRGGRRVFVSGIGMISAAGDDAAANFAAMSSGRRFPCEPPSVFESRIGKPVFECSGESLQKDLLPHRRTFALCLRALDEALSDAGIGPEDLRGASSGVSIGTTVSCNLNDIEFYSRLRSGDNPGILPLKRYFCGDISLCVALLCGIEGPVLSVANACSSGSNAISTGAAWIRAGHCDLVIAGGADELNRIPYCGFNSLQVMSDEPCLPFDERRKGMTLGEGAGILVLESQRSAENRGHAPLAELLSWGEGSDAYHITGAHPDGRGLRGAITSALSKAGIKPSEVEYINAHGTGTRNNDQAEARVLYDIFGPRVQFSSTKYYTGHTLGAAGAIEAAVCVKGLAEGTFPGNPGIIKAEDVAVAPVEGNGIFTADGAAMSTSIAFGGSCVALLFGRPKDISRRAPRSKKSALPKCPDLDDFIAGIVPRLAAVKAPIAPESLTCISIGAAGPFGKGVDRLKNVIKTYLEAGCAVTASEGQLIPDEVFADASLVSMRRRADRLSMAAFLAAEEALSPSGQDNLTAVVVVTSLGAFRTTFKFLDGILDFGEETPSPAFFSNSVHNAPAFYITSGLSLTGPSITVNGFDHPFENALLLADSMLRNSQCSRVLLVAGDETCPLARKMLEMWNGDLPYKAEGIPCEASAAFLLSLGARHGGVPMNTQISEETRILARSIFGTGFIGGAFDRLIQILRTTCSL